MYYLEYIIDDILLLFKSISPHQTHFLRQFSPENFSSLFSELNSTEMIVFTLIKMYIFPKASQRPYFTSNFKILQEPLRPSFLALSAKVKYLRHRLGASFKILILEINKNNEHDTIFGPQVQLISSKTNFPQQSG